MRSGSGSMSFVTITFMTMRPPGVSRARMASQVSTSNSSSKLKIRTSDIDGDAIVKQIVVENEFAEIGHHQRQIRPAAQNISERSRS